MEAEICRFETDISPIMKCRHCHETKSVREFFFSVFYVEEYYRPTIECKNCIHETMDELKSFIVNQYVSIVKKKSTKRN